MYSLLTQQKKPNKRAAFTLIELLVVISIIALLLSIVLPALHKAKQSAQSIVCRNHLRTLALTNEVYSARWENWYVPVIDTTMTLKDEPTWNSNQEFREIVGLGAATTNRSFVMPEEYLCPVDKQSDQDYWRQIGARYQNYVSYGYNLTDWGPNARNPAVWSGDIPYSDWACRLRVSDIRSPGNKIMFLDAGDWAVYMSGANYKMYWDQYGQDIVRYRSSAMWYPVYYRHNEGANVVYFDGHVEYKKKDLLFYYDDSGSSMGNLAQNETIWFCNPGNRNP